MNTNIFVYSTRVMWIMFLLQLSTFTMSFSQNAIQGTWATQADSYRGKNGQRFTFVFPGNGTISSRVWGTDLYTDDSSIASAAVHAGLITPQNGGVVTIEIRAGAASYQASTRNGVVSQGYGGWTGSFVFVR